LKRASRCIIRLESNLLNDYYSVNLDGSGVVKTSPKAPTFREEINTFSSQITSDGKYLHFETSGHDSYGSSPEFHSFNLNTRARVRFSPLTDTSLDWVQSSYLPTTEQFLWSPLYGSKDFMWLSNADGSSMQNLFTTGTYAVSNPTLDCAKVSPDQRYIGYAGRLDSFSHQDLRVVDLAGTTNTVLTSGWDFGSRGLYWPDYECPNSFYFLPDSSKIVFVADINNNSQEEIYSVNLDGTGQMRISHAGMVFGQRVEEFIGLTPDGSYAVYYGDTATNDQWNLYSVSPNGGVINQISPTPFANSNSIWFPQVAFSPNSQKIFYFKDVASERHLFSNNLLGSAEVELAGFVVTNFSVLNDNLVLLHTTTNSGIKEMFVVNSDGTNLKKLGNGNSVYTHSINTNNFQIKILVIIEDGEGEVGRNAYEISVPDGKMVLIPSDPSATAGTYPTEIRYFPNLESKIFLKTFSPNEEIGIFNNYSFEASTGKLLRLYSGPNTERIVPSSDGILKSKDRTISFIPYPK